MAFRHFCLGFIFPTQKRRPIMAESQQRSSPSKATELSHVLVWLVLWLYNLFTYLEYSVFYFGGKRVSFGENYLRNLIPVTFVQFLMEWIKKLLKNDVSADFNKMYCSLFLIALLQSMMPVSKERLKMTLCATISRCGFRLRAHIQKQAHLVHFFKYRLIITFPQ